MWLYLCVRDNNRYLAMTSIWHIYIVCLFKFRRHFPLHSCFHINQYICHHHIYNHHRHHNHYYYYYNGFMIFFSQVCFYIAYIAGCLFVVVWVYTIKIFSLLYALFPYTLIFIALQSTNNSVLGVCLMEILFGIIRFRMREWQKEHEQEIETERAKHVSEKTWIYGKLYQAKLNHAIVPCANKTTSMKYRVENRIDTLWLEMGYFFNVRIQCTDIYTDTQTQKEERERRLNWEKIELLTSMAIPPYKIYTGQLMSWLLRLLSLFPIASLIVNIYWNMCFGWWRHWRHWRQRWWSEGCRQRQVENIAAIHKRIDCAIADVLAHVLRNFKDASRELDTLFPQGMDNIVNIKWKFVFDPVIMRPLPAWSISIDCCERFLSSSRR